MSERQEPGDALLYPDQTLVEVATEVRFQGELAVEAQRAHEGGQGNQ
jgi:hypothetical protein